MESLSSISPFRMIPTPNFPNLYMAEYTNESRRDFVSAFNPVFVAPNNKKIEGMHGNTHNSKNLQDFYQTNPVEFGSISKHLDEISCMLGTGGKTKGTDLEFYVGEKQQTIFLGKNRENHDEDHDIVKGQWTSEEDRDLTEFVEEFGSEKWAKIARSMKWRTGKQCRDRWNNHLRPNIKKEPWNEDDEHRLIVAHKTFGNKWSKIAKNLPWRSENSIKNHWNTTKRRLNSRRMQSGHNNGSKGTPLSNYIKEIMAAERDEKEMKQPISVQSHINDHGFVNVPYESLEGDFSSKYWAIQEHQMASGSGIMDYELGGVKKDMDLFDMIYINP